MKYHTNVGGLNFTQGVSIVTKEVLIRFFAQPVIVGADQLAVEITNLWGDFGCLFGLILMQDVSNCGRII